jgi:hypothetical protein
MTDERRPGPARYRIRVHDNGYELFPDDVHLEWFNLDMAPGFAEARTTLDALRRTLAVLAGVQEPIPPTFRLTVHTWPEGDYIMDWIGR